jgi:signal transduction histidine kinase
VDRLGISVRLLALLLIVSLPPLIAFGAVVAFGGEALTHMGRGTVFAFIGLMGFAWAGVVAVFASRTFGREIAALVELAEHGNSPRRAEGSAADLPGGEAYRRLASLLEERDRQMRDLATEAAAAPMNQDLAAVARHVVGTAQRITGDQTWALAILASPEEALPRGVYDPMPATEPRPLEELHAWASTTGVDGLSSSRVRLLEGPWGAFLVVDVRAQHDLSALLLAPWEGRPEPSPVEISVVTLVAQHATTVIEHALLYARLRRQADELTRLAAIQADFLRGVTHDLQTPLTSIAALASELRDSEPLSAGGQADLVGIAYQADRMRRMVSQLLTMSALEAGAIQPSREVFRVEPIIRRVWTTLAPSGRELEMEIEGPDRLAVGDPDRLEQVLWAVFDNALKYSPAGSPVSIRLSCRRHETGSAWREEIAVRDLGIGMDRATLARAFERFYRSGAARERAPDGSGIGLFTAAGLLELMGGWIAAESSDGEGTTIRVMLPAELVEGPPDADLV